VDPLRKRLSAIKWLYPGMGVKRWLVLLGVGITIISLGIGYLLRDIYQTWTLPPSTYYLTLQFIPRLARAILFGTIWVVAVAVAIVQLNRTLLSPFIRADGRDLASAVYSSRQLSRGLRVVAIGGGTGLSTLLRGLKERTSNITAIVTVAYDGGSSGRLRKELGLLPPSGFRQCIVAMAGSESLMAQLFQYRFSENVSLNGHSFGNLFIAALTDVTGSFERALEESSRVLAVGGRIVPSTLDNVVLSAELRDGVEGAKSGQVNGESQIPRIGNVIDRVFLKPEGVRAYPKAVQAILGADLIVVGPGSLYTSMLPNLLVPDIVKAIKASGALSVYVCNVATQPGETDGYSVTDHYEALRNHIGPDVFQVILANDNLKPTFPPGWTIELVSPDATALGECVVVKADVVDVESPWRHDSAKLSRQLWALHEAWKAGGERLEGAIRA